MTWATAEILTMLRGMTHQLTPSLAALAAAQGGPFTTAQAMEAGYDRREILRFLRSGAWIRLRRGVYADRTLVPDDENGRHLIQLRAVLLCLVAPVAASHVTGVALQGIALLDPDFSLIHITREGAGSSRTEAGIRHHDAALPPGQLTKVDGVVGTSAARTILDYARSATFEVAVVAAESALNKNLTTLAELREVLDYCVDWPGARQAGRVVSFASPHSESPGETMGRIAFDHFGLPQPEQQIELYDAMGFVARVDYYWKQHRTVAEFDGRL
ncbi:MAG TPA: type IV toxin-antitoxin system AbiEi family antitoxin domain-containing protein, partial [Acidothermaceae bacterium]